MVLCPAAFAEVPVDGRRWAGGLSNGRPGADVAALSVIFVGHDVVVLHRVKDLGPVQGGEIAEIGVLLYPHRAPGDIHQAVEADLSQLDHLEYHQRVVEEQVVATDDRQVREEAAEALQTVYSEEQQIVGDHYQLGEAETLEVLGLGPKHK